MTAFRGNASWTGYDMISGHWYTGPGQVDVPTDFLTDTGKAVGDTVTITVGGQQVTARIVGRGLRHRQQRAGHAHRLADAGRRRPQAWPRTSTTSGCGPAPPRLRTPRRWAARSGPPTTSASTAGIRSFPILIGLIGTLTLLLAIVAGLGVLNTVVLQTRERVHDLGVFKAIGMTPRQTIAMVVCWVAGTGLLAGLLAVPAGIALHRYVLPAMAAAANVGLPASYLNVYGAGEIVALALAGLVIAVPGGAAPGRVGGQDGDRLSPADRVRRQSGGGRGARGRD